MAALNTLPLIVDVTASQKDGLLQNFTDRQPANVPLFIRNDGVPVQVRFVTPSITTSRVWDDIDLSAAEVKLALGRFDAVPTSGTATFTYGADTTSALAYNVSAADLQTALNALPGIGSGGVVVTSPESGVYVVQWNVSGARTLISADVDGLNPQTGSTTSQVVVGDVDTREVQIIEVLLIPFSLCDTWTPFSSADATVEVLAAGSVSTKNVQKITLDPAPYAGTFQITTDILTTAAIPYNATATTVQAALNAEGTDYTVTGDSSGPWTISTVANGAVADFTVDVTGLQVPVGLEGILSLSTFSMLQAFFTDGLDVIELQMEIEVTVTGEEPVTVLQVPISVSKDVINLQSVTPTPQASFYTQAQVNALLAALTDYEAISVSTAGDTEITIPEGCKIYTIDLTIGAGSGAYTRNIDFGAGTVAGQQAVVMASYPASVNPTITVRDNAGPTSLYSITGSGTAYPVSWLFTWTGSTWKSNQ